MLEIFVHFCGVVSNAKQISVEMEFRKKGKNDVVKVNVCTNEFTI